MGGAPELECEGAAVSSAGDNDGAQDELVAASRHLVDGVPRLAGVHEGAIEQSPQIRGPLVFQHDASQLRQQEALTVRICKSPSPG